MIGLIRGELGNSLTPTLAIALALRNPNMSAVYMWPVMGQSHPKGMPKMVDDLGKLFEQRKAKIPTRKCCAIIARKKGM